MLDPEQNSRFQDHYLELDYDLSDVMFVTTANSLDMPQPLLDRMEIIRLEGYTEDEKVEIAKRHLIPKQIEAHGLKDGELIFTDDGLRAIIRHYTREAGVRTLERELAKIARKSLRQILEGKAEKVDADADNVGEFLGVRRFRYGVGEEEDQIGAVTGLAWTEVGGELLTIEAVTVPGKGQIKTTGKLGEVMTGVDPGGDELRQGARARATASSRRSSRARTSTSTCPKARCPRTGRRRASAWSRR